MEAGIRDVLGFFDPRISPVLQSTARNDIPAFVKKRSEENASIACWMVFWP
jgi:hypothetical protein